MLRSCPIIAKELIEVAGRAQTYLIRVGYAAIILLFFYLAYQDLDLSEENFITGLGVGADLYHRLLVTQFILIMLVVPPLVASAITSEKENGTIHLLLTLPVSSLGFLVQKLAGRLIPVISLILISTPLMALSFVLGGVTSQMVLFGTLNCMLTAISVGSLALAVSCLRDTSARATIETYAYLLILGPSCLSPIIITSSAQGIAPLLFAFMIAGVFVVVGLSIASNYFRDRAVNKPESEPEFTVTEVKHRKVYTYRWGLPADQPVTWLELIKFPLRHREYSAVAALIVVAVFGLGVGSYGSNTCLGVLPLAMLFMVLAGLFRAQNAVLKFKQNELLAGLLTTPLSDREILHQLFKGRSHGVTQHLSAITLLGLGAWLQPISARGFDAQVDYIHFLFLVIGFPLITWIHLQFMVWLGFASTLLTRTGLQAMSIGLGFVIAPFIIDLFLFDGPTRSNSYLSALLPTHTFNIATQFMDEYQITRKRMWTTIAVHIGFWLAILWGLRTIVLSKAAFLLRRHL